MDIIEQQSFLNQLFEEPLDKEKTNIAIIDADLVGRKKHRFPNLACMKISAYWKEKGANVILKLDYNNLEDYDKVYISKVFTDTKCLRIKELLDYPNVIIGGTGFFFDKAPNLPSEIEHHFPDYNLYSEWVQEKINSGYKRSEFKEYLDYSIGFLTRGCFRKCKFCVNQKYDRVFIHSPLKEFYDPSRKKICLLDDNFFGCSNWKEMLEELRLTNKPFKFKQGLDERLLTDEKCELLFNSKYDGDITFAFDNIADYDIIEKKLQLIRSHTSKSKIKFYVLVGFESTDAKDIENAFIRIELLFKYHCLPYIMRYQSKDGKPYLQSKYAKLYISIGRWVNQVAIVKKKSLREFCLMDGRKSVLRSLLDFEKEHPKIAEKYFDMKW